MADVLISQLPDADPLDGSEFFELEQGGGPGASRRVRASALGSIGVKHFTIGDGSAVTFNLVHNFGTRDVEIRAYRNVAPFDDVIPEVSRPDLDHVTVSGFPSPPAQDGYRIIVRMT